MGVAREARVETGPAQGTDRGRRKDAFLSHDGTSVIALNAVYIAWIAYEMHVGLGIVLRARGFTERSCWAYVPCARRKFFRNLVS